jgi:hypothetical protein
MYKITKGGVEVSAEEYSYLRPAKDGGVEISDILKYATVSSQLNVGKNHPFWIPGPEYQVVWDKAEMLKELGWEGGIAIRRRLIVG